MTTDNSANACPECRQELEEGTALRLSGQPLGKAYICLLCKLIYIPKTCPQCGEPLNELLLLGVQPDGYVCTTCKLYYSEDLQPLARMV